MTPESCKIPTLVTCRRIYDVPQTQTKYKGAMIDPIKMLNWFLKIYTKGLGMSKIKESSLFS